MSTFLGFSLSSFSRSYRERRAQSLAEQRATATARAKDEEAFRTKVLDQLNQLNTGYIENKTAIGRLEGAAGVAALLQQNGGTP